MGGPAGGQTDGWDGWAGGERTDRQRLISKSLWKQLPSVCVQEVHRADSSGGRRCNCRGKLNGCF